MTAESPTLCLTTGADFEVCACDICQSLRRLRAVTRRPEERPPTPARALPTPPRPPRTPPARVKTASSWGIERSLPPERDFPLAPAPTLSPRGEQAAWEDSDEAARQNDLVRAKLFEGFDGFNPGPWVDSWTLFLLDNILAVNSRASDVRKEVKDRGLDVDSTKIQTADGKHCWAYRICRAADSLRLKRAAKRHDHDTP